MADDSLCMGDSVCLYSEELYGYVYTFQSSTIHSEVAVSPRQERLKPFVPDPQVFTFEVCVANRYKLNNKYRKLKAKSDKDPVNITAKHSTSQAKIGADAENEDNITEQRRQLGKKVLYGQVIQLRHGFSGKYIHVSTTQTSKTESSNMQVSLQVHNAKHAHFRIMPRYKVKAEGDIVGVDDQIVLESVKSSGQYLHVSKMAFSESSVYSFSHELNLSVIHSAFTIYRRFKKSKEHVNMLRAGELVRFFHKEIEAYLVAEGLFDDKVTEDVHLRLRPVDQSNPKTMFPSSSAITYWQIELLEGPTDGGLIHWEQQCRIKHMTTRQYLTVEKDGVIGLTKDNLDPKNVFKLHPVIKEAEEIGYDTFCRIEHVLSGTWLHASTEEYKRKEFQGTAEDDRSVAGLKWTTASFKKIVAVPEKQYDDAFTLQVVDQEDVHIFNYMAGMVPFVQKLITEKKYGKLLDAQQSFNCVRALQELKSFMIVNGVPNKKRQKLMRNLRIVELLVSLLKIPYEHNDQHHLTTVFVKAYDVLYTYLMGNSRKNELYIAKHIPFFQKQIEYDGDIGLHAAHMTMELIKDNRKIVDRISKEQISHFVQLLKRKKNFLYLDLLSVLCVCDGVSIPDNQSFITNVWLQEGTNCVFYTELGQVINRVKDVVYVSTDNHDSWLPLHEFAEKTKTSNRVISARGQIVNSTDVRLRQRSGLPAKKAGRQKSWIELAAETTHPVHSDSEQFNFLEHQLDLFGKLCYGCNEHCIKVITTQLGYLTWEEAFICLTNEELPDQLRAKYCDLIIALFVDVVDFGEKFSLFDNINLIFVYGDVGNNRNNQALNEAASISVPGDTSKLRDWITQFLYANHDMTASLIGHNMLIEQVLRLISYLVKYGFYDKQKDMNNLLKPLLDLLDGRNDKPYPNIKDKKDLLVAEYRKKDRFKPSIETKAIVDAKFRAMEVLELILNFNFNTRLEGFVMIFKQRYHETRERDSSPPELAPLLYESFELKDHSSIVPSVRKSIEKLFNCTAVFKRFDLQGILKDLSYYEYDYMVTKSMKLLCRYYSFHEKLFQRAVRAQVLLTDESVGVLYQVRKMMPTLRHLSTAKMSDEQTQRMISILQTLIELCCLEDDPEERHPMNQTILYNHGIIEDIFQILTQDVDIRVLDQYQGLQTVFKTAFDLLRVMARGNTVVQQRLFDRLDLILAIKGAEPEMANTLKEVFTGNKNCCMRILPLQVQKIMTLAAEHLSKAPQFLDLLNAVVKIEELDLPLKRNQDYVMKYFMQYRSEMAFVIDQPKAKRKEILENGKGETLTYLITLVDMLVTCAEGENQFIESICQTIFSIEELLEILTKYSISNNLKRPFLRFLLWVYLNTASGMIESGAGDLPHDSVMWDVLSALSNVLNSLTEYGKTNEAMIKRLMKNPPSNSGAQEGDEAHLHHGSLHYVFQAVLPFLQVFFRSYYQPDCSKFPEEADKVDLLARALEDFSTVIGPLISNPTHMKVMVASVSSVMSASTLPVQVMEDFQEKYGSAGQQQQIKSDARKKYEKKFSGEQEINDSLNIFAVNFSIGYGGANEVEAQIGFPSTKEYTEIGEDEDLPLGPEFQEHINCFINHKATTPADMYKMAGKLIQQLSISHSRTNMSEKEKVEQEELDIKCLKLLRGIVHNEVVKLPPDWESNSKGSHKQMQKIMSVVTALNDQGAMLKTLPHLSKQSDDIVRETLAFLVVILFNGHEGVQQSVLDYFLGTREETFFFAIKNRMHLSAMAVKERRLLMAQHQAQIDDTVEQERAIQRTIAYRHETAPILPSKEAEDIELEELAPPPMSHETEDLEYRDDGYIELVLRLLAEMCDGQNQQIQDYIREQPDNINNVYLVAETSKFLSIVYSNINNKSIALVTQLFSTLNEFTSGNSRNQASVFDNKVCDYVNHVLRSTQFKGCTVMEIYGLKRAIGYLMMSLMEENKAKPKDESQKVYNVAKEVMESLDQETLFSVMSSCHQQAQTMESTAQEKEKAELVGFLYYHILCRMMDLDEDGIISKSALVKTPGDEAVWVYYERSTLSVEIVKDDVLQRVYFRVKDKTVLHEEIKEKFKYSVDRSSPSDKHCDFMEWAIDIIKDIKYQKKIHANRLLRFFVIFGRRFDFFTFLISLSICLMVLISWDAPKAADGSYIVSQDGMTVPAYAYSGAKEIRSVLSVLHNLLSICMVVSYFVSNRPSLPRIFKTSLLHHASEDYNSPWMNFYDNRESHLDVKLFGFRTFYYISFLVFSVLGTAFYGYFFAFHLLHIASMNQLLSRVIGAVTKNGLSLIMVAILGLIFLYIYALISFAFYRDLYNAEDGLYCDRMYECFITLIHNGLIDNTYNYLNEKVSNQPFTYHFALAIYNVTFFILLTTIGLNIIFGIIVDTFSELRDSKWKIDDDMTSVCFICSRRSYDFDHHAKGFQQHVKKEHHQWSYLFFFMHLDETRLNDYTAIELDVYRMLVKHNYDFFPMHRALSLKDERDATDAKIDSLMQQVNYIISKMKKDESRKERERERKKQMEWKKTYKQSS